MYPISALDDVLPRTKILVMALPSTPETVHILNRERIALLPADACVINVGRGTALDQKAPGGGPEPAESWQAPPWT